MIVRAVTGFLDPGWPLQPAAIAQTARALKACRGALQDLGYEVQTLRLATPPPVEMSAPVPPDARADLARQLEAECFLNGIDYAALGPVLADETDGHAVLSDVLAATETVFSSALYADVASGLSLTAARLTARAIREIAEISPDGFGNLRFAALVNVPAGVPFFPAAYHRGGPQAIALATEAADLAVEALREAESLHDAREALVARIEAHAAALQGAGARIAAEQQHRFLGIDFSLAPYPEPDRSIGTALLAFGARAGAAGALAGVAFLTDCLDRARFKRTGFCGLFLPVLEDAVLADRAASGALTLDHLLLYSAVCGTGLDTIPLPGDVPPEDLKGLLIDLAALGLRHMKPLTARLMPIPGKSAGDPVTFEFPYFADSGVMRLRRSSLEGLLQRARNLDILPLTP